MGIENSVLKYIERPFEVAVSGVKKGAKHVGHMITSMDGLYYLSELVSSIFDAAEKFRLNAPTCIRNSITVFRGYMDLTCSVEWINRFNDWTTPDRKGRYIWQRSFAALGYYASLTVSDFTNLAYLLEQFKFVSLGAWAAPVNAVYTFSTISSCFFDILESKRIIDKTTVKTESIDARQKKWQRLGRSGSANEISQVIQQKWQKWTQKDPQNEHVKEKKSNWFMMQHCKDASQLRSFCRQKASKWQVALKNNDNKIFRHWCSIACSISYIALLVLGAVVAIANIQMLLLVSVVVTIAVNAIYVVDFFLEEEYKKVKLPEARRVTTFSL